MRVVLLVSNPYRDLAGLVLTALRLSQHGVTCFLLPTHRRHFEIWTLAPDLVLFDNLRTGREKLLRRLLWAGIRVVVLDTEGGVFTDLDRYADKLTPDPHLRRQVSRFCAWGPALARRAVHAGWFDESQVVVTGVPRLDLYVPPWNDAAVTFSSYADAYARPLVLINGNFNRTNPWLRPGSKAIREFLGPAYDEEGARRWVEIETRTREELVRLSGRLAEALPNVTFVYRPHPFEDPETYRGQLAGLPNLHLVKQGSVEGWILRASAVIHCGSSTAVEAALAGRAALSPAWIPTPARYPVVDAVTMACSTEDELLRRVQEAVDRKTFWAAENLQPVLAEWFAAPDGLAHERVAAAILEALAAPGPAVNLRRCETAYERLDRPGAGLLPKARSLARRTMGLPVDWSFRRWGRQPARVRVLDGAGFDLESVRAIAQALGPAMQRRGPSAWRGATADDAQTTGHYRFGYAHGCAVTLAPGSAGAGS
jgi:surface carbohydrate biosynthesis protein